MSTAGCWTAVKEHRALPDDWFPSAGPLNKHNVEAQRICKEECPIRDDCLIWALNKSHTQYGLYGIWGGTLPRERMKMARSIA